MNNSIITANADTLTNDMIAQLEQTIAGPEGDAFLAGLAVLSGITVILLAIAAVSALILLICRWKIFTKAGEKGWKSLIPIYSTYVEFSFTWSAMQGLLMLGALLVSQIISIACAPESAMQLIGSAAAIYAAVLALIQTHKLSVSFGHKFGFTLGLFFLNPIFMLMLAFGKKSQYVGPAVKAK